MANRTTPWGMSDSFVAIAPGITVYGTPSHGGYHITGKRVDEWKDYFPDVTLFGDRFPWFEEDCDWVWVCLRWPEHFPLEARQHVADCINGPAYRSIHQQIPESYWQTPEWTSIVGSLSMETA